MIIFDQQLHGGVCLADLSVPSSVPLSCPSESSLRAVLHQSVFLSAMSPQPGRDLSLCWEQHRKLLPGVSGETAESVQRWSVQQVRATGPRGGGGVGLTTADILSVSPSLSDPLCLSAGSRLRGVPPWLRGTVQTVQRRGELTNQLPWTVELHHL